MIPDNVEKIIMTKEDYDRNVEQLLVDKCKAELEVERLNNIIDELEKYIKTEAKIELYKDKTAFRTFADSDDILKKLNELKGDNK